MNESIPSPKATDPCTCGKQEGPCVSNAHGGGIRVTWWDAKGTMHVTSRKSPYAR